MPSQVIELAYLSALLEQQTECGSSQLSNKLEIFRRFLEDVVQVVPFESIAYAITNGNSHTAMQCLRALITMDATKIPKTAMMYNGLKEADYHAEHGVPLELFFSMELKAAEMATQSVFSYDGRLSEKIYTHSGKFVYERYPLVPCTGCKPVKVQTDMKNFKPFSKEIVKDVKHLRKTLFPNPISTIIHLGESMEVAIVSKANIEDLYPIYSSDHEGSAGLKSPLSILISGHKRLTELSMKLSGSNSNQEMLKIVNTIRHDELDTCTSLLGGFMHQGLVHIGLSHKYPQKDIISLHATASVGVWALFSLDHQHIKPILSKCQGEQLLIKLFDHVKGITGIIVKSLMREILILTQLSYNLLFKEWPKLSQCHAVLRMSATPWNVS